MEMHAVQSKQASMSSGCIVGYSKVIPAASSVGATRLGEDTLCAFV